MENNNMEVNLYDNNLENNDVKESNIENKNDTKGIIILIAFIVVLVIGIRFVSKIISGPIKDDSNISSDVLSESEEDKESIISKIIRKFNKDDSDNVIEATTYSYSGLDITEYQKDMLESVGFGNYISKVKEYTGKYPDKMDVELYNEVDLCVRFNINDYEGYFYYGGDIAYGNIVYGVNCIYEWFPNVELVEVVYNYGEIYYMDYYPLTFDDLKDKYNPIDFSELDGYAQIDLFATHELINKYFDGNIPGKYDVSYTESFRYLSPSFHAGIEVRPNGHDGDSFVIVGDKRCYKLYKIL